MYIWIDLLWLFSIIFILFLSHWGVYLAGRWIKHSKEKKDVLVDIAYRLFLIEKKLGVK